MPGSVVVNSGLSRYAQNISVGPHLLQADEPRDVGGNDEGPNPHELLLAALGACTSMTVRMYAERKQWPLRSVEVRLAHSRIHAEDCAECDTKQGCSTESKQRSLSLVISPTNNCIDLWRSPTFVRFIARWLPKSRFARDWLCPMDPNKPKQKERKNRLRKQYHGFRIYFGSCRAGRSAIGGLTSFTAAWVTEQLKGSTRILRRIYAAARRQIILRPMQVNSEDYCEC